MEFIKTIIALIMTLVTSVSSIYTAASNAVKVNTEVQNNHMAYLEQEYYTDSYTPSDENLIAGFDIGDAVANNVKFNEVSFIGTHNSYQQKATDAYKNLYDVLEKITFGIVDSKKMDFTSDYITDQFELGIRSIEIDIETKVTDGKTSFIVCHDPFTDTPSSCYDFEKALDEIKMWSDNNPNHLPITIIIEPKQNLTEISGIKNFNLSFAKQFDEILREKLGNTLLTPDEMMGSYKSLGEMRADDGWMPLEDTFGKVMVLLHETAVTEDYIASDKTIKTQAMFPMLRYDDKDRDCASFIIDNEASSSLKHNKELIKDRKLIVRTRADAYTSFSDKEYSNAINSGAQIVSTDYPLKVNQTEHAFTFDGGYTVMLNK